MGLPRLNKKEEKPDRNRTQIAELFIHYAFNYLRSKTPDPLSEPELNTISNAMSFSSHLTRSIGTSNRHLFPLPVD